MGNISSDEILPAVHDVLRRRFGHLDFVSGQGITKGQRVEFEKKGRRVRCVIKMSSGGRISFGRREDGTWSGLSESDYVLLVGPKSCHGREVMIWMFEQKALKAAFNANYVAQKKAGMEHLPSWLAPFHEEARGARGVGDGFGDKALWTEPLSPAPTPISTAAAATAPKGGLTIQQAKILLAETFGISPDAIEIHIKG